MSTATSTPAEQRKRAAEWAQLQEEKKRAKLAEKEAEAKAAAAAAAVVAPKEEAPTPSKRGRPARKATDAAIANGDDMSIASGTSISIADSSTPAKRTRRSLLVAPTEQALAPIPEEATKPKRTTRRTTLGPGVSLPDDDDVSVMTSSTINTEVSVTGTRRSSRLSVSGAAVTAPIEKPVEKPTRIPKKTTTAAPSVPISVTEVEVAPVIPKVAPEPVEVPPIPQQSQAVPAETFVNATSKPAAPAVESNTADPVCESLPVDEHTADQLAIQASLEQCFQGVGIAGVAVGLCVDYSLWLTIVFLFITIALLRRLGQVLYSSCSSSEEDNKDEE